MHRRIIVLTNRDNVQSHEKWASTLGAEGLIHEIEANAPQRTEQSQYPLVDGVETLHVLVHTDAHIVVLHRERKSLFMGDHLFAWPMSNVVPWRGIAFGSWAE